MYTKAQHIILYISAVNRIGGLANVDIQYAFNQCAFQQKYIILYVVPWWIDCVHVIWEVGGLSLTLLYV